MILALRRWEEETGDKQKQGGEMCKGLRVAGRGSHQGCQVRAQLCTMGVLFIFTVEQGVKWIEAEFMSEFWKLVKLTVEQGDFLGTVETPSRGSL